jgi:MFS family permease
LVANDDGGPGGVRGWLVWLIASLCLLFQFLVQLQPSVMIGELEHTLSLDAAQLGKLTSAYFVTYLLLQVPVGWLLDRYGPRLVLTISMILSMGGMIWFGYASSLGSATAARIGLGVAGAPAFPAAALVAARWFPARRFALMLGLTESFTLLGGVVADIGLPQLLKILGRGHSGLVLGGVSLVLAIACALFIRDHPERDSAKHHDAVDAHDPGESILHTILNARVWLAALHGGLFFGVVAAFGGLWAVPFLHARLEIVEDSAMLLLAVLFLSGVVGAPLLGLASAKPRWRAPVLLVASIICTGSIAAVVYAPGGIVLIAILLGVLGFVSGAYAIDLAFVREAVSGRRRGLAMGMANLIFGIVGGPLMLMIIAMSLQGQSGTHHVSPMTASLDQMRIALGWFVGALAFLVPIGIALILVAHRRSCREDG